MIFSQRDLEGYVRIDHRDSPGITPEQAARAGRGTIPVGRGILFESPTRNCVVCTRLVVLNPDRSRARHNCMRCGGYVCDDCAAACKVKGGNCKPFKQLRDEFVDAAAKGLPWSPPR